MYKSGFWLFITALCLFAPSTFAQNIYDSTAESESSLGTMQGAGMPAKDYKATVTAAAKKNSDALLQELQQQLAVYRAMNPVMPGPSSTPSGTLTPPPAATTPNAAPTPPPQTSVINAPATPSKPATYTGFGTQQPQPAKPAPSSPAPNSGSQWNIRY